MTRDSLVSDKLSAEFPELDTTSSIPTNTLASLVTAGLETYSRTFLVIDGLDEAAPGEAAKSLNWLLSLVQSNPRLDQTAVRVLVCGQRDSILAESPVSAYPTIMLEASENHRKDIEGYCASVCSEMRQKFGTAMTPQLEETIMSLVPGQSCGEFSC